MQGGLLVGGPQIFPRQANGSGNLITGNFRGSLAAALAAIFFGWLVVGCGGGTVSSSMPEQTTNPQASNPPTVTITSPANAASLPVGPVHVVATATGTAA